VAYIGMVVFVKGIPTPSSGGFVTGEPLTPQIAVGLMIAFGIAAAVVKLVFNFGWHVLLAVTAILNVGVMMLGGNPVLVGQMAQRWPAATFASSPFAILPVQIVAFGTLGSVLGYWLTVRYNIWRKEVAVS
jgi:hypothetical protein